MRSVSGEAGGLSLELSEDGVYSELQKIFQRGLVIVVGSGASCAMGLPGMAALAEHLVTSVPLRISAQSTEDESIWRTVSELLEAGTDLESALGDVAVSDGLAQIISNEIAECVLVAEGNAVREILSDESIPPFGRLFTHLLRTAPFADVVTTNYDRLLEIQAARANVRVDTMFYGHTIGRFDPQKSRAELHRAETLAGKAKTPHLNFEHHVRIYKPHGSLDWYTFDGEHYRSDLPLSGVRRIVAPGGSKYRSGYETPFDTQRERANAAIDNASALLFVGYGFNDDHLQTHIREQVQRIPTVVISRQITDNAREYISTSDLAIGIEAGDADQNTSRVTTHSGEMQLDKPIWQIDTFMKEVLRK